MAKPLFFPFFSLIIAWNGFWHFFFSNFWAKKNRYTLPTPLVVRPLKKHFFYVCLPLEERDFLSSFHKLNEPVFSLKLKKKFFLTHSPNMFSEKQYPKSTIQCNFDTNIKEIEFIRPFAPGVIPPPLVYMTTCCPWWVTPL